MQMLRGFIVFFFGGLPKFFINKNFRKLFLLGIKLLIFPSKSYRISGKAIQINDKLGFFWQYYDIFYRQYYHFSTTQKSAPVILDCGANIGLSAFWFLKNYPQAKVYCFEPDPDVFEKLKYNLSCFKPENYELINKAVFTSNTTQTFVADGKDGGMLKETIGNNVIKVETLDFKEFMKNFSKIDMLKIDIEGAEQQLIPHIKDELHKVNNLFIEYHQRESSGAFLSEILQTLEETGFYYRLESPVKLQQPITNQRIVNGCFLQINIFASKIG
ncbi:MAG: FkbM family methyltransferase [Bacteroidetes bacterium]|nr:FkbM family methyltransferase [Bacteroidota bacterium]